MDKNEEPRRIRNQVRHFISMGRYERAKSIASDLISKYPEYPYVYYDMSVCQYYLGSVDDSIELCLKSLELGMRPLAVYIMLMVCYNEKDDFTNVDDCYNEVNRISPGEVDAKAIYGYSLWRRGKKEEGIRILEEAINDECTNTIVLRYILLTSKRNKNKEQLKELIRMYMNTGASEKNKLLFTARAEAYMKNWKEAREYYGRVLSVDPMNEEANYFFNMMDVEEKLKKGSIFIVLWIAAVLMLRFDQSRIITYVYFIPALIYLAFLAAFIYKKKTY